MKKISILLLFLILSSLNLSATETVSEENNTTSSETTTIDDSTIVTEDTSGVIVEETTKETSGEIVTEEVVPEDITADVASEDKVATECGVTDSAQYDYIFDTNCYIKEIHEYSNGVKTDIYVYYPNTTYGSHTDDVKYAFTLNNDETIKEAVRYNESNVLDRRYTYYAGTKYGNHSTHIMYYYYIDASGNITKCEKKADNTQNIINIYIYFENTKYGDHGDDVKYKYYLNTNETLNSAKRYTEASVVDRNYVYYPNTYYGTHSDDIKYIYNMNSNGTIHDAIRYTESNKIDRRYTYYSGTKYGDHSTHIQYLYYIDSEGDVTKCEKKANDTQKITTIYTYYDGAKYGSHGDNIQYKYMLNSKGDIYECYKYRNKSNLVITYYTYYPGAKYGAEGNPIKYKEVRHYTPDQVKTGYTKYYYDSNGNKTKVDANTYITPYAQLQDENVQYDCPSPWSNLSGNGCLINSFSMMYSAFNNDELTPKEIYNQGYRCNLIDNNAYENLANDNGMLAEEVTVKSGNRSANPTFSNPNNIVPNGKSTFTMYEALVYYGMPVQVWLDNDSSANTLHPSGNHSVIVKRYTWTPQDGAHYYMYDPYTYSTYDVYDKDFQYKLDHYGKISKAWVMKPE